MLDSTLNLNLLAAYARFEQSMGWRLGSYAKTVIYRSAKHHVCPTCGGPKLDSASLCYSCTSLRQQAEALGVAHLMADRVRMPTTLLNSIRCTASWMDTSATALNPRRITARR